VARAVAFAISQSDDVTSMRSSSGLPGKSC